MGRFVQFKVPCLKGSGLWKLDPELEERFYRLTLVATDEQESCSRRKIPTPAKRHGIDKSLDENTILPS